MAYYTELTNRHHQLFRDSEQTRLEIATGLLEERLAAFSRRRT